MAYPGVVDPSWKRPTPKPEEPNNQYPGSIVGANRDYEDLMKRYRELLDRPDPNLDALRKQYENQGNNPKEFTPTPIEYKRGEGWDEAFGNLRELARTGGFSGNDIAELRARGISPIRAVYANAQRRLDRQKSLQGGYSPNYTAATAKMSRDLSEGIAGQVSNVNAGIAQMQAEGRLRAAPAFAGFVDRETGNINDINAMNESNRMKAFDINNSNRLSTLAALERLYGSDQGKKQGILDSMRALYGTTPAQPALYGQQAFQRESLGQNADSLKQNRNNTLLNYFMRFANRSRYN